MKETISIEYLSSGSRVPDKLRDRVPGNKLPGYGSPTKHQQALQFHKERTRLFTGSIPRLRLQSNWLLQMYCSNYRNSSRRAPKYSPI